MGPGPGARGQGPLARVRRHCPGTEADVATRCCLANGGRIGGGSAVGRASRKGCVAWSSVGVCRPTGW
jgi:hypothetical protein